MIFTETPLPGAFVVEIEKKEDERGFFARTFCWEEFQARGLNSDVVQCNVSFNTRKGTLRGMHFQTPPFSEVKLVRCTAGSIYDVIIDLRRSSPAFKQHFAIELSASNRKMLYIPEEFAHGFQTLDTDTEVFYQMSRAFSPQHARGVRWNDPAFGIQWPLGPRTMNQRDQQYPDFV